VSSKTKERRLAESTDMAAVKGSVDVEVPISTLWEAFTHANWWPRWNRCMLWVRNGDLVPGKHLLWAFRPIRWWYLYVLPAIAKIVEVKDEERVTWEITALPGFYARHTYHMKDLGSGRTRFGSWEKAMGRGFRLTKWFWIPHFIFVKDHSLEGIHFLEEVYLREGRIDESALSPERYRTFSRSLLLLVVVLAGAGALWWFYSSYLRQRVVELAPDVYAVFGGGGNSLIVRAEEEVLLVDTKFSPASRWLRDWISKNIGLPVKRVVNTHYHYDHTAGNVLYPEAAIFAHKNVPDLMLSQDNEFNSSKWWENNRGGVPTERLDGRSHRMMVGNQEVVLAHPGRAHTSGDLVLYLPRHNIIVTGDLVFNGHYPFLDRGEGGVSVAGLIEAIRRLAESYPEAIFLPGHGPLARVADLRRHADYLEFLQESVKQALSEGLSEDQAAERIDFSGWDLSILPSFHGGKLSWATANNNARWVYRILKKDKGRD
jgi:glyoxylase-like metal-dependent hydrolase (beta-lactamase superfamily II)